MIDFWAKVSGRLKYSFEQGELIVIFSVSYVACSYRSVQCIAVQTIWTNR